MSMRPAPLSSGHPSTFGACQPRIHNMWFHLGEIKAIPILQYWGNISILRGVYVGETTEGVLVYRSSLPDEHPSPNLVSMVPVNMRLRHQNAARITENPAYRSFDDVYVELGRLGGRSTMDFASQNLEIVDGLFIGRRMSCVCDPKCIHSSDRKNCLFRRI